MKEGKLQVLRIMLAMVILIIAPANAIAAYIYWSRTNTSGGCAITVYGDISDGDQDFFDAVSSDCTNGGVLFKSRGGNLVAGLKIGEMIRARGLETAVSYDAQCASACALAWLGGVKRNMFDTSLIGFHAAYTGSGDTAAESGVGNALVGAYMAGLGLPTQAVVFAASARPNEMNWLDYRDAKSLGIAINLLAESDRHWIDALDQGRPH